MTLARLEVYHQTMTHAGTIVPAETDLLCEGCGYTLTGLPEDSNCPECGKPIAQSIGSQRRVPAWEQRQTFWNFLGTSAAVLFRPTWFYQNLATRREVKPARLFAIIYWVITSILFVAAARAHIRVYLEYGSWMGITKNSGFGVDLILFAIIYATLHGVTSVAARLTNWEATYRGLRMPLDVVLRGMYYHAAHYLPVALLTAVTVWGYLLLGLPITTMPTYLYVLCGEVIVFAAYLFNTYWIGMRNMMYANR
jgi:hypothetical protein